MLTEEYWRYFQNKKESLQKKTSQDPWRLHYHLMPETGWMNDPNGLCQFKGVYHFYHQYVPTNPENGEPLHWAHKTSKDLVTFKEEDLFLSPDKSYNKDGVYSGSAFVKDDKIHYFYTGNVKNSGDFDYLLKGREQHTIHVVSSDGYQIESETVVIPHHHYPEGYTNHIRDPKVFEKNGKYYMLLGARNRKNEGNILIYQSNNLDEWEYKGIFLGEESSIGYMYECPDYFELNGQAILAFSTQGLKPKEYEYQNVYQSGYVLGAVDWQTLTFKPTTEFIEFDRGFDFYAPQTFEDEKGRRISIGWMGIGDTQPEYLNPTVTRGWQHAATLPKELVLADGKLFQKPILEYEKLRLNEVSLQSSDLEETNIIELTGTCFELLIKLYNQNNTFSLKLGQDTQLLFSDKVLTLHFGESGFGRSTRSIRLVALKNIHLFVDSSSIEIFINDGEFVMTSRVYPTDGHNKLNIQTDAQFSIKKWDLAHN